jgi:hypothetical protein
VGGAVPIFLGSTRRSREPRRPLQILSNDEFAIFAAAAARLCPPAPDTPGWPSTATLECAEKVDGIMAGLHPRVAAEFRKLLHVFENTATGLFSIGSASTFTASSAADQDRRLNAWRRSRLAAFRSGYQAMKRLSHATYYSSTEIYALVGYPGPPVVPQVPA